MKQLLVMPALHYPTANLQSLILEHAIQCQITVHVQVNTIQLLALLPKQHCHQLYRYTHLDLCT